LQDHVSQQILQVQITVNVILKFFLQLAINRELLVQNLCEQS